jgi:hypothetical protein
MGGLFIAVVVLFPNGLAGLWDLVLKYAGPVKQKLAASGSTLAAAQIETPPVKGD